MSVDKGKAWQIKKKLNIAAMKLASNLLVGTHDFSTFRASSCGAKSPIRKIKRINISKRNSRITIKFESQSFLQQQVRSMVGCLKYVGDNKWSIRKFEEVFKSKERKFCATPAPPEGLYLKRVIY